MKLPGILSGIIRAVGNIVGTPGAANAIAGAIDNAPPEMRAQLEAEINRHEEALRQVDLEALRAMIAETQTMVQSGDKFVSRARPTGLYVAYAVTVAIVAALITGATIDPTAILTVLTPCWGAGGYYMKLRSDDKRNGGGA